MSHMVFTPNVSMVVRRMNAAPKLVIELESCLSVLLHEFPEGQGHAYDRHIAAARAALLLAKGEP